MLKMICTGGLRAKLFAAVVAVGGIAQVCAAAPIAYEPFAYTDAASLSGQNLGAGWAGAWSGVVTNGPTISSPGLTYASLTTAGLKATTPNSNVGAFRTPTLSPDADGTTLYISVISQSTGTTAGYTGLSLFNGGTEVLFLGKPTSQTNWGLDGKGTPTGTFTSLIPAATQSLLVYRIDFGGGTTLGNERVRLYVNPTSDVEPAVADVDLLDKGNFTWDNLRLQAGNAGAGVWDELRLATTFAEVAPVPEPATLGTLAIAAAALGLRRRRR